ncbi:hypothetical protein EYF80_022219 [Liparis tanakae]|uniref:Uncharacterized protein n=1 Tax=Liparis tanakae TaxID=230148 RepID=A0A4Z2HNW8_9TELE|nr:hypothetical protein EYF80_022219 [Liparis tanakae]
MSVILSRVSFLTRCNDIQRVNLTVQHQSPAHFLSSGIGVPYQSFVWGAQLGFTGLLTRVPLLGKHRPHGELWTGAYDKKRPRTRHVTKTAQGTCVLPVQHDVIQGSPLHVEHVRVQGRESGLLLQQPHVVGEDPLEKRAGVRPLDGEDGPVRKAVAHEPGSRLVPPAGVPVVPSDADTRRSRNTGEKRHARIATRVFCGARERSPSETQHRHVAHGDQRVVRGGNKWLLRLSTTETPEVAVPVEAFQIRRDVLIRAGALPLLSHVGHVLLVGDEAVGDPARFVRLHHQVVPRRRGGDAPGKRVPVGHPSAPVPLQAQGVPKSADSQVKHLAHVQHQAKAAHHVHDEQEDGLLRGPGDEAVHSVRTGDPVAHVRRIDPEAVEEVLSRQESDFKNSSRHELQHVDPHQAFLHYPPAAVVFGRVFPGADRRFGFGLQRVLVDHGLGVVVSLLLQDVLQTAALSPSGVRTRLPAEPLVPPPPVLLRGACDLVDGVAHVHDGGGGDHDDLEDPEADVREGGEGIVAHVVAARLLGVAGELGLLVRVDGLASDRREHDAEDDEHRQPHFPHEGGVVVDLFQETSEKAPAHVAPTSASTRVWEERAELVGTRGRVW